MASEAQNVKKLFRKLRGQLKTGFPKLGEPLDAPSEQAVYVIRRAKTVLHVGRTLRGKGGLRQRLNKHLQGSSSFSREYLKGGGRKLRRGYTYQFLLVKDARLRALLEAFATGTLCPKHIGLGM